MAVKIEFLELRFVLKIHVFIHAMVILPLSPDCPLSPKLQIHVAVIPSKDMVGNMKDNKLTLNKYRKIPPEWQFSPLS